MVLERRREESGIVFVQFRGKEDREIQTTGFV